ncbi:MAG: hypothetical protein KF784_02865 [Fimbriimonadaceae bacterium]|nr:hypothetical protein [Fimbriimonadaceae bacterium]
MKVRTSSAESVPYLIVFAAAFSIIGAFQFGGAYAIWLIFAVPYILASFASAWGIYRQDPAGYVLQSLLGLAGLAVVLLFPSFPPTIFIVPVNILIAPYSIYLLIKTRRDKKS